ncbi:DUF4349 domain-containing protein [Leptospira barantonii]|uniref:DUF4349 domain-containing protein n=1 Tax=Leptospira barantonii TaxID=2023184 RepID=A0ABX4NP70_9LEPT|nr:DUF4349 domain-containing protein [Leptospira barantonii]PJZ58064.1 hypothetical protein CH367_06645 [Leptospira barantonii]
MKSWTLIKTTIPVPFLLILLFFAGCSSREKVQMARTTGEGGSESTTSSTEDRMISFTANLDISVKDIDEVRKKIKSLTKEWKGFVTRDSSTVSIVRVPSENLEKFLMALRQIGDVESEDVTGLDITDFYKDNLIKLESFKRIKTKYQALIDKAHNVQDLLAIERELERVNVEIERLEGSKRSSEMQTKYSTVYINLKPKKMLGPLGWIFYGVYKVIGWLFVWD